MPLVTTWKINDMKRDASTGGVEVVYWHCEVRNQTGTDGLNNPVFDNCCATEMGKLHLTPDASADDFVAFDSLTEDTVLSWVYNSLRESDDETADEAKARIEGIRQDKVNQQIARQTAKASGMPW